MIKIDYNAKPPQLYCTHCKKREELSLPITIREMRRKEQNFKTQHKNCKKA